jgi:uncharacterized phage-associated protein
MADALDVAKYIIKSLPTDNLKLQKLLYYSQAFHLVLYDKIPLFEDKIEAWDYGPVMLSVYKKYKRYGLDTIPPPNKDEVSALSLKEMKAVDMAIARFGVMSGPELINRTHHELPWKNAYKPKRPSGIITTDALYSFFKKSLPLSGEGVENQSATDTKVSAVKTAQELKDYISKTAFILDNLSNEDCDVFLYELGPAIFPDDDEDQAEEVLSSWLEVAEINADPVRKKKLENRRRQLFALLKNNA